MAESKTRVMTDGTTELHVHHEFAARGSHRVRIGSPRSCREFVSTWKPHSAPVVMKVHQTIYVAVTDYFNGEKVERFTCSSLDESRRAFDILKWL